MSQVTSAEPATEPGNRRDTWTATSITSAVALLVIVLAWAAAARHVPRGVPSGVVLHGIIIGSLNGLLALGLVLIYRTSRVVNFAQGALGAFSAVLAFELMAVVGMPWIAAVTLSLLAALLVSVGLETTFLRRLASAPRLIFTVATIGLAQILTFLNLVLQPIFEQNTTKGVSAVGSRFPTPFDGKAFELFPVLFRGDDVLVLVTVPLILVALTIFMRRSWVGMGIRASAENRERAGLLGCPTPRLSTYAWGIAGLLSGVTAILSAPVTGSFAQSGFGGTGLLLRGMAAAAIGSMVSLPRTFAAALALGVIEQVYYFNYSRTAPIDGLLVAVILIVFLLQRRALSRSAWNETSSWQAAREVRPVPRELAKLREVVTARHAAFAVLALGLLVWPLTQGVDTIRLTIVLFVYAMVGVSLVVLTGWGGQVSLGQWAVTGCGAFVTARLATSTGLDPILVLCAAVLVGAAFSVLLGLPALRIRGVFAGVTTLAFAIAAESWFFTFDVLHPRERFDRPMLLSHWRLDSDRSYYYLVLAALVLVVLAARNLRASRVGRLMIAVRDNDKNASSYGVEPTVVRLTSFAIAGGMAGLAGGLYAYLNQQVASTDFPAVTSLFLFAIVVIGGLGSITGAILGAVYVKGAEFFLPDYARFLATGVGMLLLLIAFPGGLSQLAYDGRDRLLRRLARRRQLLVPSLVADRAE